MMKRTNLNLLQNQQQLSISEMKEVKGGTGGGCTVHTPDGSISGLSESDAKLSGFPYECGHSQV